MNCIYGWWNINGQPIEPKTIESITKVSSWWKPDSTEMFHENNIALLQLNQKRNNSGELKSNMEQQDGLVIVCDARLDNRHDLLRKLSIQDISISDSLLILQAYRKYGEECAKHLIGAFAFAIYDAPNKKIYCVRDQLGIKPFNYYFRNQNFLFGTQRKSILSAPVVDAMIDWEFVVRKLSMQLAVGDSSENLYIKKLLPSHSLTLTSKGIKISKYWEFDTKTEIKYKDDREYVDHFLELFKLSISDRMRGASVVGAHLSGGFDSSGIASVAAELSRSNRKTFKAFGYAFPEDLTVEIPKNVLNFNPLVEDQVKLAGIEDFTNVTEACGRSLREKIEYETLVCDGISWSNNVNTEYELQNAARNKGAEVILSGFLGDELITSKCNTSYYLEYLDKGQLIPFFKAKAGKVNKKVGYNLQYKVPLLIYKQMNRLGLTLDEYKITNLYSKYKKKITRNKRFINKSHLFRPEIIAANKTLSNALNNENVEGTHKSIPLSLKEYQRNKITRSWTSRRIESEGLSSLPFHIDYRYPMADIRLNQYVMSIPVDQKRNNEHGRLIFRRAMENYIPKSILKLGKYTSTIKPLIGFRKNIEDNSLNDMWKELLSVGAYDFLDVDRLDTIFTRGFNGKVNLKVKHFYNYSVMANLIQKGNLTYTK